MTGGHVSSSTKFIEGLQSLPPPAQGYGWVPWGTEEESFF